MSNRFLVLVLILVAGCATSGIIPVTRLDKISVGMSRAKVVEILEAPENTHAGVRCGIPRLYPAGTSDWQERWRRHGES